MPWFDGAAICTPLAPGVWSCQGIRGGEPVLAGTRFPTAQLWSMVVRHGWSEDYVRGPQMFPWMTAKQYRQGLAFERKRRRATCA